MSQEQQYSMFSDSLQVAKIEIWKYANTYLGNARHFFLEKIMTIPGGTQTLGNVRICSGLLVNNTRPSDDCSRTATATFTP